MYRGPAMQSAPRCVCVVLPLSFIGALRYSCLVALIVPERTQGMEGLINWHKSTQLVRS